MSRTIGKISVFIAVAGIVLAISGVAQAASTTGTVTGTIGAVIGISKTTDMNFGRIVAASSGGTVVLSTSNGRTVTGGTTLATGGTSPTAAAFNVTGELDSLFSIGFSSGVTLKNSAGTHSLTADTYVAKVGSTADQSSNYSGTLSTSPIGLIVGATLNVGASTPAGTYSTENGGTPLTVTVAYN